MTKRTATLITTFITVALCAAVVFIYEQIKYRWPDLAAITPGYYQITKVVDGDTIEVLMDGKTERIRMIGVDTPETKKPNAPVQCFGLEASEFATKTLSGQRVRLDADATSDNRDRYDRLLRYVYTQNGELFQQKLIAEGYAFAYTSFGFSKKQEFIEAQSTARAENRGLWAACTPKEQNGRWQSNDL